MIVQKNKYSMNYFFIAIIIFAIMIHIGCNDPGSGSDEEQPNILSVFPENGETAVPLDASIIILFSERMNQNSVEQAVSLNPGNLQLAFSWNSNGNELQITPDIGYYDKVKTYTLTIAETAENMNGENISEDFITTFTTLTIPQVCAGYNFTICLKFDGSIIGWGNNTAGQLGNGTSENPNDIVSPLLSEKVQKIDAAEGYFSVALTSNGKIYIWGKNDNYELGLGNDTDYNTPQILNSLDNIFDISCGKYHSIAVNSSGDVFSWGDNHYYQTGIENPSTFITIPAKTESLNQMDLSIAKIKTGSYFSGVLTNEGKLYLWGGNYKGQLGMNTQGNDFQESYYEPHEITGIGKVIDFDCGNLHVLAIVEEAGMKKVYSWGFNSDGQLGRTTNEEFTWIPGEITGINENVIKVSAGTDNSSFALTETGDLYAWGETAYSKLGISGIDIDPNTGITAVETPTKILDNVIDMDSGNDHAVALCADGSVWTWGSNTQYQLGRETTTLYDGVFLVGITPGKVPGVDLKE
jgi:alpha-tubulin suppressor-like RCC1 family protein